MISPSTWILGPHRTSSGPAAGRCGAPSTVVVDRRRSCSGSCSGILARFTLDGPGAALGGGAPHRRPQRARLADAGAAHAPAQRRSRSASRRSSSTRSWSCFAIDLVPGAEMTGPRRGDRRHDRAHASRPRRPRRCWRSTTTRPGTATSSRRQARRERDRRRDAMSPASLFLEIDGLAHEVARSGRSRDGDGAEHRALGRATARTSSSAGRPTGPRRRAPARPGFCTATNHDMPAFRWWEKERGAAIVTNHPRDAARSSAATPTGAGCCTPTAPAGPTSSPATPPTRC